MVNWPILVQFLLFMFSTFFISIYLTFLFSMLYILKVRKNSTINFFSYMENEIIRSLGSIGKLTDLSFCFNFLYLYLVLFWPSSPTISTSFALIIFSFFYAFSCLTTNKIQSSSSLFLIKSMVGIKSIQWRSFSTTLNHLENFLRHLTILGDFQWHPTT